MPRSRTKGPFKDIPLPNQQLIEALDSAVKDPKTVRQRVQEVLTKPGASEALSSHVEERWDLIPRPFLHRVAVRFGLGAKKYPPFNFTRGLNDKEYVIDRINHLIYHVNAFLWPITDDEWEDDNLAAIAWGVAFLMLCNPAIILEIRKDRSRVMTCIAPPLYPKEVE
jgi:Domain of unknown function (DUF5664)